MVQLFPSMSYPCPSFCGASNRCWPSDRLFKEPVGLFPSHQPFLNPFSHTHALCQTLFFFHTLEQADIQKHARWYARAFDPTMTRCAIHTATFSAVQPSHRKGEGPLFAPPPPPPPDLLRVCFSSPVLSIKTPERNEWRKKDINYTTSILLSPVEAHSEPGCSLVVSNLYSHVQTTCRGPYLAR